MPSSEQDRVTPSLIVVAGPTASGKSEAALLLAEQMRGEIVAVDSMQVYRGMDIGTAKPSKEEQGRVPHHLIDVVEVTQKFDAAQFARLAWQSIEQIRSRGKIALLCGGTGLYLRAVFDGVGEAPPANAERRKQLEQTPLPELLRELAEWDPVTYEKIDRKNPRRVVRAIEVIRQTGRPFSEQKSDWHRGWRISKGAPAFRAFGLLREAKDLHDRINRRVDSMFERGLVEETRRLLDRGLAENATAMQALGYRQVVEHLRGDRSLGETIELVKLRTRQFAKRQMTWFRYQIPLEWIEVTPGQPAAAIAEQIVRRINLIKFDVDRGDAS
jgi:tRNA dimethylallyltransferase